MGLVSMKEMLLKAKNEGYAVAQFNMNTLLWAKAILEAAEEMRSPVIVASSDRLVDYLGGYSVIASTVKAFVNEMRITVPVALHLDHGTSVEHCKKAINAGYTSVMIDGSRHSIEKNIAMTREVVEYARKHGVSVEAEVGTVGGSEDGLVSGIQYADPDHCERLVKETGVDALAAALGSVHGPYRGEPKLGFAQMKQISGMTDIPLVLHGGSGIPDVQIQKAIGLGHAKINVNTESAQAWTQTVREIVGKDKTIYEVRKILEPAHEAIKKTVKEKVKLFGSVKIIAV